MVATIQSSLRTHQYPLIGQLANCIEGYWERYLSLSPYEIPQGLGYIEGNLEGEKLVIENRCYQTPQFRKLHLELARIGNRLDILHCVMFPHSHYPLPIFGVDLVGSSATGIGAAIVDLSPVSYNFTLPLSYYQALANLPEINFAQPRVLPQWGYIFSEFCLFVRPVNSREEKLFFERAKTFLSLHCQTAIATDSISSSSQKTEIIAQQRHYCNQQQKNDKTRRVLEKSLGKVWTNRYMTQMLFDCP